MAEIVETAATYVAAIQEYVDSVTRLTREARGSLRVEQDVAYGDHERQRLDVYMPKETVSSGMPVLVFIHGGGWRQGTKDWMGFMAPAIVSLPAIFVSVGYRLAPDTKYPAPEEDCRAALKWTYQNIEKYGGDRDLLFVGGHSAGGHLAAMLALRRDLLEKEGLPLDVVKGCFPMAGVFDLTNSRQELVESLLPSMDMAAEASPNNHVAGNKVPFYISIGENDNAPLIPQARQMADALRGQGSSVGFLEMKGCDHFQMNLQGGDPDGEWARTVREWMASTATA